MKRLALSMLDEAPLQDNWAALKLKNAQSKVEARITLVRKPNAKRSCMLAWSE